MSTIPDQLFDFLVEKYNQDRNAVYNILNELLLTPCFIDKFPEKISKIRQLKCKVFIKNKYNMEQYKEIYNLFQKENIPFCTLKGTPLTYELFGSAYKRYSDDLDIFVKPSDMKKSSVLLGKLGYQINGIHPTESSVADDCLLKYGNHHMYPFTKFKTNIFYVVELHNTPYPHTFFDFSDCSLNYHYTSSAFSRIEKVSIETLTYYQLELHDRLLQMMLHYSTHLLNDFRDYLYFGKKVTIKFDLLLNIALFINKYESLIDWDIIKKRSAELKICIDIKICINHLKKIFRNLNIIFNPNIEAHNEGDIVRRLIYIFLKYSIDEYLNGNIYSLFLTEWNLYRKNNCLFIDLPKKNVNRWYKLNKKDRVDIKFNKEKIVFRIPFFYLVSSTNIYATQGIHFFIFHLKPEKNYTDAISIININGQLKIVDTLSYFCNKKIHYYIMANDYDIEFDDKYIYASINISLLSDNLFGLGIKIHHDQFFSYQLDCPTINHILINLEGGEKNGLVNSSI